MKSLSFFLSLLVSFSAFSRVRNNASIINKKTKEKIVFQCLDIPCSRLVVNLMDSYNRFERELKRVDQENFFKLARIDDRKSPSVVVLKASETTFSNLKDEHFYYMKSDFRYVTMMTMPVGIGVVAMTGTYLYFAAEGTMGGIQHMAGKTADVVEGAVSSKRIARRQIWKIEEGSGRLKVSDRVFKRILEKLNEREEVKPMKTNISTEQSEPSIIM